MIVQVQIGHFERSPIESGKIIWVKRKKNKSTRVMAFARSVRLESNEWKVVIGRATKQEEQNYKCKNLIKRLKP